MATTFSDEQSYSANETIPSKLRMDKYIDDDFINAHGLYSKEDIEKGRFSKYSRFGRVLDPYGRLTDTREYLFFVKPDLHICVPNGVQNNPIYNIGSYKGASTYSANGLKLNPQLENNLYFRDLIYRHPDVCKELQSGITTNADPFSKLLSFSVSSNLDLPGSESTTIDDLPATMFGTRYEYLYNSERGDENPSFSLEFMDTKYLDVYHFFKAYSEYHMARKSGLVTPPSMEYYKTRRTHNTMGVYKFLVAEDMETIIYWAYFWGVYPMNTPRETFGDPAFQDGLTFSVNFNAAFMEDMNPALLYQFNKLMCKSFGISNINNLPANRYLPVVKTVELPDKKQSTIINGALAKGAFVFDQTYTNTNGLTSRPVYKLKWYS